MIQKLMLASTASFSYYHFNYSLFVNNIIVLCKLSGNVKLVKVLKIAELYFIDRQECLQRSTLVLALLGLVISSSIWSELELFL